MISLKSTYSLTKFFPAIDVKEERKKFLTWLFLLALLMAFLELGQDYISSVLNGYYFSPVQSLSYKLFWLLFIPFSLLLIYGFDNARLNFSKIINFTITALFVSLITLAHLVLFSLLLNGISDLVYAEPWPIKYLLTEKLSTRLYIGFSVYIIISVIYYRVNRKEKSSSATEKNYAASIPVKNGRNTTLVKINTINWISSDGPYLSIKTEEKGHVILGSLKHIINNLPENFKRIHRSTIVNIDQIKKLKSRGNGDYDVVMKCGKVLRLSRNYTQSVRGSLL